MMRYDSVILFSGGIDSFVGYHYLNKPQPIYFNMNTKYSKKEINNLKNFDIKTPIIDNSLVFLGDGEQNGSAYVPFRNLYLAMTAVSRYSDTVYICGLKDDVVSDKNEEVFKEWSQHLSKLEGREINIISPFWNHTKEDIVKWYSENYDKNDLLNTISCYSDTDECHCGKCKACFRKACVLYTVGIELPFYDNDIVMEYKKKLGTGHYDLRREETMKKYFKFLEEK